MKLASMRYAAFENFGACQPFDYRSKYLIIGRITPRQAVSCKVDVWIISSMFIVELAI